MAIYYDSDRLCCFDLFLALILVLKVPSKMKSSEPANKSEIQSKGENDVKYLSAKAVAQKWNISERMVCKYCAQGRIPNAYQSDGLWYIPEDTEKPIRKQKEIAPIPLLLQEILAQREDPRRVGIYDYLQVNMVYSNGRMASNRLTRNQVEGIYKTDKICTANEPMKVNDIVEARNHFLCVDAILTHATKPLTVTFINQLLELLVSDNCRHKRNDPIPTGYRKSCAPEKYGKTTPTNMIHTELTELINEYESLNKITLENILDFHVKFERIRPYEDCNGRIGRLLMLKECLRHDVTPFIIDDKRRAGYLDGIRQWDENRNILTDVCIEAQMRFEAQIKLLGLLKRRTQQMREYRKGGRHL